MKKTIIALSIAASLLIFINYGVSGVNMQEGKWQMTIVTEMAGMPYAMPPMTYTDCLTRDDMNPQKEEKNQDCKQTSSKVEGNTYSWTMECRSSEGITRSSDRITYRGTAFDGVINTTTQGIVMKQKISGKRIGACSK